MRWACWAALADSPSGLVWYRADVCSSNATARLLSLALGGAMVPGWPTARCGDGTPKVGEWPAHRQTLNSHMAGGATEWCNLLEHTINIPLPSTTARRTGRRNPKGWTSVVPPEHKGIRFSGVSQVMLLSNGVAIGSGFVVFLSDRWDDLSRVFLQHT